MIKVLLIFCSIISVTNLSARKLRSFSNSGLVVIGEPEAYNDKYRNLIIGSVGESFYVFKETKIGGDIIEYNRSLKTIQQSNFDFKIKKNKKWVVNVFAQNEKIYVITVSKVADTESVNLIVIDLETMVSSKEKEVFIYKEEREKQDRIKSDAHIFFSPNGEKRTVLIDYASSEKEYKNYMFIEFDEDWNELYRSQKKVRQLKHSSLVETGMLDNSGNLYFQVVDALGSPKLTPQFRYQYKKSSYFFDRDKDSIYKLKIKTKLSSYGMVMKGNGESAGIGYAKNSFVYITIKDSIELIKKYPIPQYKTKFNGDEVVFKKIIKTVVQQGKEVIILGEYYYHWETTMPGGGRASDTPDRTITKDYYGPTILTKFDNEGNIIWQTFVDKLQNSKDGGGYCASYGVCEDSENMYILFNEYYKKNVSSFMVKVNKTTGVASDKATLFENSSLLLDFVGGNYYFDSETGIYFIYNIKDDNLIPVSIDLTK